MTADHLGLLNESSLISLWLLIKLKLTDTCNLITNRSLKF
jgi:hypothetical protein